MAKTGKKAVYTNSSKKHIQTKNGSTKTDKANSKSSEKPGNGRKGGGTCCKTFFFLFITITVAGVAILYTNDEYREKTLHHVNLVVKNALETYESDIKPAIANGWSALFQTAHEKKSRDPFKEHYQQDTNKDGKEKRDTHGERGGQQEGDLKRKQLQEEERKQKEEEKRREEEAKKKLEEKRKVQEAEKKRKDELKKLEEEKKRQEEEARVKKAEEQRKKLEAEKKKKEEEEERKKREEAEKKKKEEEERKKREEAEKKKREEEEKKKLEAEKKKKEEEERKKKAEAEKKQKEEEEKKKAEAEKKKKEDEERKKKAEAEKKQKEEEEKKKVEAEKKQREEEERKKREEAEKKKKEEEERKKKQEAEKKRKEEEEKKKLETEKKKKEEEERKKKAEAEKKQKEEEERKKKQEAEKKQKEEEEKKKLEAEKKQKEEEEKKKLEAEKKKKEEEERKKKEEAEKKKREEEERKRLEAEKKKKEEEERKKREEDEKKKKEEEERKKREEDEKKKKEEEERKKKEETEKRKKDEEEKKKIEEARKRLEEEKRQDEEKRKMKEAEEKKRIEEEKKIRAEEERKQLESEKKQLEANKKQMEDRAQQKDSYDKSSITNKADFDIKDLLDDADNKLHMISHSDLSGIYDKILAKYPKSPRANFMKAEVLNLMAEEQRSNNLLDQAITQYQVVLDLPDVTDDLLIICGKTLAERQNFRGWSAKSAKTLRFLSDRFPNNVELKNKLGVSYMLAMQNEEARKVFKQVLEIDPKNGYAKCHLGFIYKLIDNDPEKAVPLLTEGIASQEEGTRDGRFYFHLGDALQRLNQTENAYKIYQAGAENGLFLSMYQRSLYNVNHLTGRPWWTLEETGYQQYFKLLQDNWKTIRDEGLAQLDAKTGGFVPEQENLRESGDWKQFVLWRRGQKVKENCDKTPKTCELIDQIIPAKTCTRGQVKFSVIHPGAHIWPHCGPTNCRLRAHLGLKVPPGLKIRVGQQTRTWEEGKFIVFDDSFEHEVWHNGNEFRLVLIVDFWHPELTEEERRTLSPI